MSSILEMLTQQLGGGTLKQISGQLGSDEKATGSAMATALPMLLGALSRNASRPEGAQALANALDKDHDGSVLDNLSGLLGNPQAGSGDGILRHVLGDRRQAVERNIGKASGLGTDSVGKLMTMLAPVVMGALGRQKRSHGLDAGALSNLLNQERESVERQAPAQMGLIGKMLDADGDGDVDVSDFAKQGLGMLGKLFGK